MGLCKCPKKKVTNLFCFEHRVNVCEHCLVLNHPQCIVRSYLQWLQDSDYDPSCRLCGKVLGDESAGPCVRLVCYDVLHWACLDKYARQLPANTAPAGYTCPVCSGPAFPAPNVASPVADSLKQLLSQVNWARAGLGLPLIEEARSLSAPVDQPDHPPHTQTYVTADSHHHHQQMAPPVGGVEAHAMPHTALSTPGGLPSAVHDMAASTASPPGTHASGAYLPQGGASVHSVITVDDSQTAYARTSDKVDQFTNPRRLYDSSQEELLNVTSDHDEDKYKRRPALQWFSRWFQSRSDKRGRADPNASCKRLAVLVVLGILAFLTMIIIFSQLGKAASDDDPMLDPMFNPNIRVEQKH